MFYYLGYRMSRWFFVIWLTSLHFIKVFGRQNLPKKGPFILAPNHSSLGDPPVIGVTCNTMPLHFLAKEELFNNKRWGWWFKITCCIPIPKSEENFKALREALRKLKENRCVVIFPEGTRSASGQLGKPEVGIGFLALKSKAPVIPIFISGTEKALPVHGRYRIGIPVKSYIGRPVDFKEVFKIQDRKNRYRAASDKIMQAIAELKRQVP